MERRSRMQDSIDTFYSFIECISRLDIRDNHIGKIPSESLIKVLEIVSLW